MLIKIEISETDAKKIIKNYIENTLNVEIDTTSIRFMVKSKQNYKSEWENASFKVEYDRIQ